MSDATTNRISRRDALRKGAKLGGAVLWIAPAIQTLPRSALAQAGSPLNTCCECRPANQGFSPGDERCGGVGAVACSTDASSATSPAASADACRTFCLGLNRAWCFHEGPMTFSCSGNACVS